MLREKYDDPQRQEETICYTNTTYHIFTSLFNAYTSPKPSYHPTDNIDASKDNAARTSSHNTRRETVTGHTPPIHVKEDCKYTKL
jgi:predicted metal-dependent HD superfamily phosphohydrolase